MEVTVVVWEFSFQHDSKSKWKKSSILHLVFTGKEKFVLLLEQPLNLLSGLQLNQPWPQLKCSAPTTPSAYISCTSLSNSTPGKLAPLNTPSVFWYSGRPNGLTGLLFACPFLSPSQSLTSAGCFCWAGFPIVHTLSWLASQGCCWLLGPLIGSSCALAFLARLGLACARSSQTTQGILTVGENQSYSERKAELHQNHLTDKFNRPNCQI